MNSCSEVTGVLLPLHRATTKLPFSLRSPHIQSSKFVHNSTDHSITAIMGDAKPKKNFFKKPAWLEEKAKTEIKAEAKREEKQDATTMFARSTGTMSDAIAEQKRKDQLRAEKKARAKEEKSADGPSRKRRKTSEDGDYEADRDEKKYGIFWLRINGDADNEAETRYRLDGRRDSPVTHRPNR